MKKNHVTGVSREAVEALKANPALIRIRSLRDKYRSGTATQEEKLEYEKILAPVRAMKPGVLVD